MQQVLNVYYLCRNTSVEFEKGNNVLKFILSFLCLYNKIDIDVAIRPIQVIESYLPLLGLVVRQLFALWSFTLLRCVRGFQLSLYNDVLFVCGQMFVPYRISRHT